MARRGKRTAEAKSEPIRRQRHRVSRINTVVRRVRRYGRFDEQYPAVKDCRRAEVLGALACCRQGELGAKQHCCSDCGTEHVTLNACGNRHCPNCARQSRYLWHRDVLDWSLNCDYLHCVCTLPHELNPLVAENQPQLLRLLFRCVREVLLAMIRKRYGCTPGLILVLHSWGQRLNYHFHIHAVMTAGGLTKDQQQWIEIDQDAMEAAAAEIARLFKAKYLRGLQKLLRQGKLDMPPSLASEESLKQMLSTIDRKDWIANVGATPQKYRESGDRRMSLGYVGKYVAGTAIGDGRIIEDKNGKITFRAFDYRTRESIELTMGEREFVDAFSQHILPLRLRRFRMAGIFAPQGRSERLAICRELLGEPSAEQLKLDFDETHPHDPLEDEEDEGSYVPCPVCDERMQLRFVVDANIICPLLEVAAIAFALLQAGAFASIRQAILKAARADHRQCPARRALLAGIFGPNEDQLEMVKALVEEKLRDEAETRFRQQRAPPGTAA